jgi:hypothetical protein
MPVCQRQALSHEPFVDIELADKAAANDPPVLIYVALVARDTTPANELLQRERGLLAAAPVLSSGVEAALPALRRVDAVQANALAVDLDRVAVENRGDAGGIGETCSREAEQYGRTATKQDEAHSPCADKKSTHSRTGPLH